MLAFKAKQKEQEEETNKYRDRAEERKKGVNTDYDNDVQKLLEVDIEKSKCVRWPQRRLAAYQPTSDRTPPTTHKTPTNQPPSVRPHHHHHHRRRRHHHPSGTSEATSSTPT